MRPTWFTAIAISLFALAARADFVPNELVLARDAYQHAHDSRAADLTPAELHKAEVALIRAEEAWASNPESTKTRDLSYVAQRKAQLAEALGNIELARRQQALAGESIQLSELLAARACSPPPAKRHARHRK